MMRVLSKHEGVVKPNRAWHYQMRRATCAAISHPSADTDPREITHARRAIAPQASLCHRRPWFTVGRAEVLWRLGRRIKRIIVEDAALADLVMVATIRECRGLGMVSFTPLAARDPA